MRKKNYKGRVGKRIVPKCEDVCRTFDVLQYKYADLLSKSDDVESFQKRYLKYCPICAKEDRENLGETFQANL